MDRVTKEQRSALMARVRTTGTDIESCLIECVRPFWSRERYRKNVKNLPGKPDVVFSKSKIVIFADGDFWHGKDFKKWGSRIPLFWKDKISSNMERDKKQTRLLRRKGYVVLRFWGSQIKENPKRITEKMGHALTEREINKSL